MSELANQLRELEKLGAPLTVKRYPASDDPDFGNTVTLYVGPEKVSYWHEFDFWESDGPNVPDVWALTGWAVSWLEARGLRRGDELTSLLQACLALPTDDPAVKPVSVEDRRGRE